jgi:mannose-6-phosphate isomerase-like protein (cupin superfamily)
MTGDAGPSRASGAPVVRGSDMLTGEPLSGWHGRFFHAERMTFSQYDVDADAAPLHEHRHPQEEVWQVISGDLVVVVAGEEHRLGPGDAVVVPPDTPHSARTLGGCRALVADSPRRDRLPGGIGPG